MGALWGFMGFYGVLWGFESGRRAGGEVFKGEKGSPEPLLGSVVVEGEGEGWQGDAGGAPRPGEPCAGLGGREGGSRERIFERVDVAGCAGTDRHEGVGLGG